MNVKRVQFLLTLAIAVLMMAGLLALLGGSLLKTVHAQGTIRYVAPGGSCGGVSPCYSTMQDAVDAAQPEDEIRVAEGTYTGINNYGGLAQAVYVGKSLTIRGGYTTSDWTTPDPEANPTELNAMAQGRVMVVTGTVDVTVEGLRLTYGNANGLGGGASYLEHGCDAGGGVYVLEATVTLRHTWVLSSTTPGSGVGGGVYMRDSTATVVSCIIQGNSSGDGGGGLLLNGTEASLRHNTIQNNDVTATNGAGVAVYAGSDSKVTLSNNTIQDNSSTGLGSPFSGAVHIDDSEATIEYNVITNTTGRAGGITVYFAKATITGNTIQGNRGAGIRITGGNVIATQNTIDGNTDCYLRAGGVQVLIPATAHGASVLLEDNLIQHNRSGEFDTGGGVSLISDGGSITLTRNTIQDNVAGHSDCGLAAAGDGGGVYIEGDNITLRDNVIQRNTANGISPWGSPLNGRGGGIYLAGDATLINNIVTDNDARFAGAGLYIIGASPSLYYNTIANNPGGSDWDGTGVYVIESGSDQPAQPELYNTIVASQKTGVYASGDALNVVTMDGVLWWGNNNNTAGGGTFFISNDIPGDPDFVDAAGYDYHIGPDSAAVDNGIDAGITDDIDGQTRPHYDGYDLGADEWWPLVAVKTATPDTAEPGGVVTYTLTLTNATDAAMTVSLTDTLPTQVSYLGPLTYSNGSGGYASGVITWTGTVLTSTPTFITWPVQVASDVSGGTSIANIATVSDAYGLFQTDPALIMVSQTYHYIYLPAVLKDYP